MSLAVESVRDLPNLATNRAACRVASGGQLFLPGFEPSSPYVRPPHAWVGPLLEPEWDVDDWETWTLARVALP